VGLGSDREVDVVIVGAGFAGLYMLHRSREAGRSAVVFEAGSGVGGTWHWNRYPGARCDVESMDYSYSWSEELQRTWRWTERYAPQPEILRYLEHVADRFDLRRDIRFDTCVTSIQFDEEAAFWTVATDRGDEVRARFVVMATGCLSSPRAPDVVGIDDFAGETYHTGRWPHHDVSFTGKRVGVIGTGSSAIQLIPQAAKTAAHLTVFQRTPNFSVPAHNRPVDNEIQEWIDQHFAEFRARAKASGFGIGMSFNPMSGTNVGVDARREVFEDRWRLGGPSFLGSFADVLTDIDVNDDAAQFVRDKIRAIVHDPVVADRLAPIDHPLGTKRICVDIDYYETYNRPNVSLVDVRANPIAAITPSGVRLSDDAQYQLDMIVFATGFDAMTGALLRIDIRGRDGLTLADRWRSGPRTYLGIMTSGFPNLFTITGPGSPSVLSTMVLSIEQHVEWITDLLDHLRRDGLATAEPTAEAEDAWVAHVNDLASQTLYPHAQSWYIGANVPGKPRVFMPYVGGVARYRATCEDVAADGYRGFAFTAADHVSEVR
jgi:cyclohexanone monooxygenase